VGTQECKKAEQRARESRAEGARERERESPQEGECAGAHERPGHERERDGDRTHLDKTLRYTLVQDRLALEPQAVAPRETA